MSSYNFAAMIPFDPVFFLDTVTIQSLTYTPDAQGAMVESVTTTANLAARVQPISATAAAVQATGMDTE